MGCVSSSLLHHDEEFPSAGLQLGHHIVSLTSTTYGLLTLDPPPPQHLPSSSSSPPPRSASSQLRSLLRSEPEVINSWELMAGLDSTNDSFRFSPLPLLSSRPSTPKVFSPKFNYPSPNNKENSNPNSFRRALPRSGNIKPKPEPFLSSNCNLLDGFEELCPRNGESKLVLYSTTLRGVRTTFEACNSVRSVIEGLGFVICERDISMDRGFRDELRELLKHKDSSELVPPRVFVKGRYLGGSQQVLRFHEEGRLLGLLEGLPRANKLGQLCDGCGGLRFLPCFQCNGSCKIVTVVKGDDNDINDDTMNHANRRKSAVIRCSDCNENGLVLCPICS